MSLINDQEILARCQLGMITPFVERQVSQGVISYGLTSYGYDIRLGNRFKIFTNTWNKVVDPKNMPKDIFQDFETDEFVDMPPNSFVLAESYEFIKMPRDLVATCMGKSTYARCGIIVNVTPLEPEWEGRITIEISNTSSCPARVYAGEGIMQVQFEKPDEVCQTSYADRKGKYQNQGGIVLPRV